jgi:CHAT domain-containing protein
LFPEAIRQEVAQATRVFLMPGPTLMDVPFGVLKDEDGGFVFAGKEVAYPLSLGLLERARQSPAVAADHPMLMGIDDYGAGPWPKLEHAVREVQTIKDTHAVPAERLLCNLDARKQRLLDSWNKSAWVHLALHGEVDPYDMYRTCLVLYDDNGALAEVTLGELLSDRLALAQRGGVATKVIYLGCCFSGTGAYLPGEGRASLAYAFLSAGVKCVVAASWAAHDEASEWIMSRAHELWRGGSTVAGALTRAQHELAQDNLPNRLAALHPEHYGAFCVYGDGGVKA